MEAEPTPKRRPGRPRGSKNTPALARPLAPTTDPITLVQRNFEMVDWAQRAIRLEMQRLMQEPNVRAAEGLCKRLLDVSNALARSIDALKKANNALEELQKVLTPQQLLEAAIKKIEGRDPGEIRYAVKRLRLALEAGTSPLVTGADALASLGDDE
jgi:hypothetical protein